VPLYGAPPFPTDGGAGGQVTNTGGSEGGPPNPAPVYGAPPSSTD